MNKAPDTRNKLDDNKGIKKEVKKKIGIPITEDTLKEFKQIIGGPKVVFKECWKKTKGQIFKESNGFSKTTRRNLKAANLLDQWGKILEEDPLNKYKFIRKKRKAAETKARQKKHLDSVLFKRANGKKNKSKVVKKEKKKKDKE